MTPDLVLEVRGVHHAFGPKRVLHDVHLRVARGQIVSLVGPSGCGKSTLLHALLGTHPPMKGEVLLYNGGTPYPVREPGRDRGIVYQHYGLYPFLTAQENVAFGPRLDETSLPWRIFGMNPAWRKLRKRHLEEAAAMLERLGLGDALKRYPHQLSGGMQQRVAIGQALIMKPAILLLDEPFGALDEATREELQELLLTLYADNVRVQHDGGIPPYTILIVTHELNEAILVGDRVVGLSQYWDWRSLGFERCPGASIVYDKSAPIYAPGAYVSKDEFIAQRTEIREVVFDEKGATPLGPHLTFWDEVEAGRVGGVLARGRTAG